MRLAAIALVALLAATVPAQAVTRKHAKRAKIHRPVARAS